MKKSTSTTSSTEKPPRRHYRGRREVPTQSAKRFPGVASVVAEALSRPPNKLPRRGDKTEPEDT